MRWSKVFLFLLVLVFTGNYLFASGSSAGGTSGSGGGTAGPVTLKIYRGGSGGRTWVPTEFNYQELMKRTNTNLEVQHSDDAGQLNLLMASGDLPDIIVMGLNYSQYLNTGYIKPLDDLLERYGQNILKRGSEQAWKLMTIQGKKYAMPYENTIIKLLASVRSDWLKNLGIDLSKNKDYGTFGGKYVTLEEYKNIVTQFTRNDPDKNGKNDTYGIGGPGDKLSNGSWGNIYGAFGGIPGHTYISNNKATPWIVTDQYRAGLVYINSLWKEGAIDPEVYLMNRDQARQKLINGVSGALIGCWWSLPQVLVRDGLQKVNPEADFIPLFLTSNDGKTMGYPDNGLISNTIVITSTSKVPEKAMEFLNYLHTDEGYYLVRWGVEGVDYTMTNSYPYRTDAGQEKSGKAVIDALYPLINQLPNQDYEATRPVTAPLEIIYQKWDIIARNNNQPHYSDAFYGLPAPRANDEYGVDVNNWIEQSSMAFITGETPLNDANWNNYINTWKRMGGVKILQGYIDAYNSLNGTKITAGITE
jgi:putative aldouronate transport system substrate-binding protein